MTPPAARRAGHPAGRQTGPSDTLDTAAALAVHEEGE